MRELLVFGVLWSEKSEKIFQSSLDFNPIFRLFIRIADRADHVYFASLVHRIGRWIDDDWLADIGGAALCL